MSILRVKSISEMHKILELEPPKHPLITFFYWNDISIPKQDANMQVYFDFYMISQKTLTSGAVKYGRNHYDFNEGVLMFMASGQVFGSDSDEETEVDGWALFFHPDLIRKTPLGKKMLQ